MSQHTIYDWLERYYHFVLLNTEIGKPAKNYLIKRGLDLNTIKKFKIGFAPLNVKPTLGFLKGKNYSFNDLVEAKILRRYEHGNLKGKITDPFKGRVILPITDFQGKTIAFGGRTLEKENKVKYINSPETKSFVKGDNLYRFDIAQQGIQKQGYAILFEGYFDTITAHQHGINNVISTLGTTLTHNQALLLKSVTDNVVITFDGDKAGLESSYKSASVLKQVGCKVKISHIQENLDPDDYLKTFGKEAFLKNVIMQSLLPTDHFIKHKANDFDLSNPNERFSYAQQVISEIKRDNDNEKETIIILKKLGNMLNVPLQSIYKSTKQKGGVKGK